MIEEMPPGQVEDTPPPITRRGRPNALKQIYQLKVGQALVCPPGWPKNPHQNIAYHNRKAAAAGLPHKWKVGVRLGVWRIYRVA